METCPHSRPSVHSSTVEHKRAKQEFPRVSHLVQPSYHADIYQSLNPSVHPLPSSTLSPSSGDSNSSHGERDEILLDNQTLYASERSRHSSSAAAEDGIKRSQHSPLSTKIPRINNIVPPPPESLHSITHKRQDTGSTPKGHRVTKGSVFRHNANASGNVARKSTRQHPHERQTTSVSNRPPALDVVRHTYSVKHDLRDVSIRSGHRHGCQQLANSAR